MSAATGAIPVVPCLRRVDYEVEQNWVVSGQEDQSGF